MTPDPLADAQHQVSPAVDRRSCHSLGVGSDLSVPLQEGNVSETMRTYMNKILVSAILAIAVSGSAAATPEQRKLRGELYGSIAQDRDRGISKAATKKKTLNFLKREAPGAEKSTAAFEIIDLIYNGRLKKESPERIRDFFEWQCLKNS